MTSPSHAVGNGQDAKGRFVTGNTLGRGNPHLQKVRQLRAAMMQAVSRDDIREVITALLTSAKKGNVPAARELMDRIFGKARQHVEVSGGGLFSSVEQRQLLIEVLTHEASPDNPVLAHAPANEGAVPDAPAHPTIRNDGTGPIQGQQPS